MDKDLRDAERSWHAESSLENYQRYAQQCRRSEIVPECYFCRAPSEIICSCGKGSCIECAAFCNGADCEALACPDCVDKCQRCGGGICPGNHYVTCVGHLSDDFCLECTVYCDECGDQVCLEHLEHVEGRSTDFICRQCATGSY